jgi:mannose-1-phosphate guanylyltransferase
MKAILLAGGIGSRLRPITDTIPKCLVPIHGQPLLDIWLEQLTANDIGPFLVNTHYLSEQVEHYIEQSLCRESVTLAHEPQLLGTAGTVWANREWIGDEPFMLVHADNYCLCDFGSFVEAHNLKPPDALMTMMTFQTDTPESCGILEINNAGAVVRMHEKTKHPLGNTANAAIYIVDPAIFTMGDFLRNPPSDFSKEVIPKLLGRIIAWANTGYHEDIGTTEAYHKVNEFHANKFGRLR